VGDKRIASIAVKPLEVRCLSCVQGADQSVSLKLADRAVVFKNLIDVFAMDRIGLLHLLGPDDIAGGTTIELWLRFKKPAANEGVQPFLLRFDVPFIPSQQLGSTVAKPLD
jgi:hypothetical protein